MLSFMTIIVIRQISISEFSSLSSVRLSTMRSGGSWQLFGGILTWTDNFVEALIKNRPISVCRIHIYIDCESFRQIH